jgi:hypothetical protein
MCTYVCMPRGRHSSLVPNNNSSKLVESQDSIFNSYKTCFCFLFYSDKNFGFGFYSDKNVGFVFYSDKNYGLGSPTKSLLELFS